MMELPQGEYVLYLRKSRADMDAELRGEGETLDKHRKALYKLAKHHKLNITNTFEEIVSGESLFHRPQMIRLLDAIESQSIKGVLVMDVDRLGRGNMQEQGLILDKFRTNNVYIITPRKIYDLNNEFDEEYSEFEAFMARKELKIITRRLKSGRARSVEEGNFINSLPAFGYKAAYDERGNRYLEIDEERAEIVKLIFQWYTTGNMGAHRIAKRLDEMNVKTVKNKTWAAITVLQMLRNEVYIGRIQFNKISIKKRNPTEKGSKYIHNNLPREKWIDVEGKHEAIIDVETFMAVQEKLKTRHNSLKESVQLANPFAGIIVCGKCGGAMSMRKDKRNPEQIRRSLRCINIHCDTRDGKLELIEAKVLEAVDMWIDNLKVSLGTRKIVQSNSKSIESIIKSNYAELKQLEAQKMSLFDYLERKIYDEDTFLERSKAIAARMEETKAIIAHAEVDLIEESKRQATRKEVIPASVGILKLYRVSNDIQHKNTLMKQILVKIEYTKEMGSKYDEFNIKITPRIK